MPNNPKPSDKNLRDALQNIPNNLFQQYDANVEVKVKLVQNEYTRDPLRLAKVIKSMIK